MIANKKRESKRAKSKMAKSLQILYKEGKCRECSVVVTRMDFAKILGKFTKVKIQYESNSSPKTPKSPEITSPNVNTRLKSNENGMVLIRRNAYNPHPAKELKNSKKNKSNVIETKKALVPSSPKSNILKENNNCKKTNTTKKISSAYKSIHSDHKQYAIIFVNPTVNGNNEFKTKLTLADLIPNINGHILPSDEWCIEYFPQSIEPKDEKMYNRIAAELEDLMYNKINATEPAESKCDEFPSIMDILNDNPAEACTDTKEQTNVVEFKPNLESSDVEAMLLGKPDEKDLKTIPMDVDSSDVSKLIEDVVQLVPNAEINKNLTSDEVEKPNSPSILDETLQKGIEEHLPIPQPIEQDISTKENNNTIKSDTSNNNDIDQVDIKLEDKTCEDNNITETKDKTSPINYDEVSEVRFKKIVDGKCPKLVTCLKNLSYNINLEEKSVELLGAPKYITSIDDIQVLLQIVNESTLDSLHVLHTNV
ncbi:uncharacterized protein LOC119832869 [Zerene cesonia]|uniref:uncharacterized protein LOC119832869 n=1 Tax=Zerene cesonia TaxID=33412 RepID=UPI0018E53159|nr:uncharacterized protein LOC119832869 [Zerene cesonia]